MQHMVLFERVPWRRILGCALAFVIAISLCPIPVSQAHGDEISDKQAEAAAVLSSLNAMQETLDTLSAEYGEAVFAQEQAESDRDAAQARMGEISDRISELQDRLGQRAREMYRGGTATFIDILLGAQSFEEFATGWDAMNKVNENDASMVQEQRELKEESRIQAAVFDEQAKVAAQKAEEAAEASAQAQATINEMQATYDSLSEEVARLVEEQRAAEEAAQLARAQQALQNNAAINAGGESFGGGGGNSGGNGNASSPAPVDPPYYPATGNAVVDRAYSCMGQPYVWGGVGPNGYDCSGLVSFALTGSHSRLGTTYTFMGWRQVSNPQPGDICTSWSHCGIYIGGGQMIHAPTFGMPVQVGPVQGGMIYVRY